MSFGGGGGEAEMARAEEYARQQRIREGTTKINQTFDGQFTPDYFQGLRTKYLDYALPQLQNQYGDASNELKFAMARGGIGDSSISAQKKSKLDELNALRAREIADQAQGFSTKAQTGVEDARSNLITTLNATGDAEQAASSAINRASVLSQPQQYNPLSSLFSDFTATLGTQAALERAGAMGSSVKPRYNTGLFGGSSAVKVS
jgi:hypothetical protein